MPDPALLAQWWTRMYPRIVADLGLDAAADEESAWLLTHLLAERDTPSVNVEDLRLGGPAVVAGDAPRLTDDLKARPPAPAEHVIAADAAARRVAEAGIRIALVVTDLDKEAAYLARLNADGVPLALHAHGDNMDALREWVPRLTGPILPTRQTLGDEPSDVLRPGGFTDGDRAVLLAARLGATRIRLVGFDLGGAPGPGTRDPERKRRKMRWGQEILADARRLGIPLE